MTGTFFTPAKRETAGALLVLAANVALWIAWTGEWIKDIITGIILGYYFIHLIRHVKKTKALSPPIWAALGIISAVVAAANAATLFVEGELSSTHDLIVFLMMLAVGMFFIIKTLMSFHSGKEPEVSVSLSLAAHAWNILFLYMSAGVYYNVANLLLTVTLLLMHAAVRREVLTVREVFR